MKDKKLITCFLALFLVLVCCPAAAPASAEEFSWPQGKRAAVSLTFDDARESQLDVGLPLLNRYGVKATFYVLPNMVKPRLSDWKKAVNAGHEIGNHSLNHPCTGNYPFIKENALEYYTLERMTDELDTANLAIERMLGVRPTSFAYPCGQTFVGRGQNVQSYVPLIAKSFLTGRTFGDTVANKPDFCDFAQITSINIDGLSVNKIRALVDEAAEKGSWLVLGGHEIGTSSGPQVTQTETLAAFCEYANDPQNGIWVATVTEIATYIDSHRKLKSNIPSVKP
ncbi:MAG: polysaccharide deacetylase family protein [Syntrophales bacterium]